MDRSSYKPKYPVQTLEKSLDLLMYMVNNPSPIGISITELSAKLEMNKSGVHRILDTLLAYRIVDKIPRSQFYRLGWGLYEMGASVAYSSTLLSTNYTEIMDELCNKFLETVNISIKNGEDIVVLNKIEPNCRLRANVSVGTHEPMHASSMGKVFMSELSDAEIESYFATRNVEKRTENTIVTAEEMTAEARRIRANGYAVDHCELESDLICIGMPIHDYSGQIAAAMSISGPASRMTQEKLDTIQPALRAATMKLSALLGSRAAHRDIC